MLKYDMVEILASTTGVSHVRAQAALEKLVDAITAAVVKGEHVKISGLCVMRLSEQPARIRRNPRTGATFTVPAHRVVKIRPALALTKAVRAAG